MRIKKKFDFLTIFKNAVNRTTCGRITSIHFQLHWRNHIIQKKKVKLYHGNWNWCHVSFIVVGCILQLYGEHLGEQTVALHTHTLITWSHKMSHVCTWVCDKEKVLVMFFYCFRCVCSFFHSYILFFGKELHFSFVSLVKFSLNGWALCVHDSSSSFSCCQVWCVRVYFCCCLFFVLSQALHLRYLMLWLDFQKFEKQKCQRKRGENHTVTAPNSSRAI